MKNIVKYIACAFTVAAIAGCSNDEIISSSTLADGEGALSLNFSFGEATKATLTSDEDVNTILQNCAVRIYMQDEDGNFGTGGMIRKYGSQEEVPDNIYLSTGSYGVTVDAGTEADATFDLTERTYYGETPFDIISGSAQVVEVSCKLRNSVVQVVYDETLTSKFDVTKGCTVALSDSYSADDVADNKVSYLEFGDEPELGYFLINDDCNSLSWCFYGESTSNDLTVDGGAKELTASGVIENIEEGHLYTLNLKYDKTPDGYGTISVKVDESEELYDDEFSFALQPSISANEFNILNDTPIYTGGSYTFNVSSTTDISYIEILGEGDESFMPFVDGAIVDLSASGVSYSGGVNSGVITLDEQFFNSYCAGGARAVKIYVVDTNGMKGIANVTTLMNGVTSNITNLDMWFNTATLSAYVTKSEPSTVVIEYRKVGSESWSSVATTEDGDGYYSAAITPTWNTSRNDADNANVYTLASGVTANSQYECRLVVDGEEGTNYMSFTTDGKQVIPNGDMEDGDMSCFTSSNTNSTTWASGNNDYTGSLCKQGTKTGMGGSACAYLQATSSFGVLAPGNLVYGTFKMNGFSGTVGFGQTFNWESRPTALRLKYATSLGTVSEDYGDLKDGDTDIARVYIAIVDWGSRHGVTAGTGDPEGCWDPATQTSTDEGKIVGYASMKVQENVSTMTSVDLEFKYYDTTLKPSSTYTLAISCATSNYGDYGVGSSSNEMWLDDFELVY